MSEARSELRNPLMVFGVALLLSLAFASLSFIVVMNNYPFYVLDSSPLLPFIGLALPFAVFYILAKTNKMVVGKSVILALLTGIIIGSASLYLEAGFHNENLVLFNSSFVYDIFLLVPSSLLALLFAEFRRSGLTRTRLDNGIGYCS